MYLFKLEFCLGISLGVGLQDHMATLFLVFLRKLHTIFQFTFPPIVYNGSPFPTPSPALIIQRFINDGYSDWCAVVLHYSFDLHFSNILLLNFWVTSSSNIYLGQEFYLTFPAPNNSSGYYYPLSVIEETETQIRCLLPGPLTSKLM